jgi:hypothetical protein
MTVTEIAKALGHPEGKTREQLVREEQARRAWGTRLLSEEHRA